MNDIEVITWDYNGLANNSNFFGTQTDWNLSLYTKISKIYKQHSTTGSKINTIIAGPTACGILEDIKGFSYNKTGKHSGEYSLIGRLVNRFDVWETFRLKNSDTIYLTSVGLEGTIPYDLRRIDQPEIELYPIKILNLPGQEKND